MDEWKPDPTKLLEAVRIALLVNPEMTLEAQASLKDEISQATIDLNVGVHTGLKAKTAIEKLKSILDTATALGQAWSVAGDEVQQMVKGHLTGRLLPDEAQKAPRLAKDFLIAEQRAALDCEFMHNDVWRVARRLQSLIANLEGCETRAPLVSGFVWRLARAWHNATGRIPTFTKNKIREDIKKADHKLPPERLSNFEKFVHALTPKGLPGRPIGVAIIADVKKEFELGVLETSNPEK